MRPPSIEYLRHPCMHRRRGFIPRVVAVLLSLMYLARGFRISYRHLRQAHRRSSALLATSSARVRSQGAPLTRSSEVDILLPKLPSLSTAAPPTPERKRPPPGSKRQGLPLELVHGVAGSRKTQHLIDVAVKAMKQGEAKRLLFLVKVGSNADEIRARLERQHEMKFTRHGETKHYYSERKFGSRSAKIWVVTVDAFVDHQLRKHKHMREQLRKHGGNWEWKCHSLHDLVRAGEHRELHLKDGHTADLVLVDEAQDVLMREGELLLELVEASGSRMVVVGDKDQLVFDKALGRGGSNFMDLAEQHLGDKKPTRLNLNHRCPASHIQFINAMKILDSPVLTPPTAIAQEQHKPYLFCAPMQRNPNDMAYRAAKDITQKILTLFRTDPSLRLQDVAIVSRYVNSNRLFMQLKEELERAMADEGIRPPGGGSEAVYLMKTKVNRRKSIEWDRAQGRMVMLSIAACKGRDWKAVFFVDVNEGVLPCPVEVPNMFSNNQTDAVTDIEREQIAKSLLNVGASRSTKYLFVLFDSQNPSRYLPRPQDGLASLAQLEWDESTVEAAYSAFRPQHPHQPNWAREDGERQQPVKRPFVSLHRISEVADYVHTVHAVVEGDGLVMAKAEQFAKQCSRPDWWKTDEMAKRIVGVMGELMLLRCIVAGGMLVEEQGWRGRPAVSVFDLLVGHQGDGDAKPARKKRGRRKKAEKEEQEAAERGGDWEDRIYFTSDKLLLNLVADTDLNSLWRDLSLAGRAGGRGAGLLAMSADAYGEALDEIVRARPELERVVEKELRGRSRCVLHDKFRGVLPKLHLMREPHATPPSVWWNAAILYTEYFDSSYRDPGLVRRVVADEADLPEELGQLCSQLLKNAAKYLQFLRDKDQQRALTEVQLPADKQAKEEEEVGKDEGAAEPGSSTSGSTPRQYCHGSTVNLVHVETNHEKLQSRNFCLDLDAGVFENGWRYGLQGKLDFYDPLRRRVVEVKCSDSSEVLEWYEVQALVYALVRGVRAYEVVNLLHGKRYRRFIQRDVPLWPVLRRVLEKLQMDEDMIQCLAFQSICFVREELRRREEQEQQQEKEEEKKEQEK